MDRLHLDFACGSYDRTRALQDGSVQAEGIDLTYVPVDPPEEVFWRMLMHREFDVAEMSLGSYVAGVARGDFPFVAIPAFVSRMFRHSAAYVSVASGIRRPEDLKGKRVGVPEYQMTATVWLRGILEDDFGVRPRDVRWFTGGQEHPGRREKIPLALPPDVHLERIGEDRTLSAMLLAGEIDALLAARMPSPFVDGSPGVRRLFPRYRELEADYFRRTGIFPIMHLVAIRRDIYERHRWIAQSLLKALTEAKERCARTLYDTRALRVMLPWAVDGYEEARALMGQDFWPYGLEANRTVLETFIRYAHGQGVAARRPAVDELFAPETLDTFRT
jgi:4,5-dihydroxyphthalate decarboxylase